MKITIEGKLDPDPRSRVLALEAVTQSICEQFDMDPAEGTMMLLTAAVHIAVKHSGGKPINGTSLLLANALGHAIVAADDFFKLREIHTANESAGRSKLSEERK